MACDICVKDDIPSSLSDHSDIIEESTTDRVILEAEKFQRLLELSLFGTYKRYMFNYLWHEDMTVWQCIHPADRVRIQESVTGRTKTSRDS